MKRSEAIQLIKEKAEHQISEQVADRILSGLEEAGMLPPNEHETYDQKPDGNWYPYTIYIWESEE